MQTMPKKAKDETPFGLVYGFEVIAPTEIAFPSHRVRHLEATLNDEQRCVDLDFVKAKKSASDEIQVNMWLTTARYCNRLVYSCHFYVG